MDGEKENDGRKRIFVVTGNPVVENGRVSFRFMFETSVDYKEFRAYARKYGWLRLTKKSDDFVDPFRLVRGEPGAVGDDGVKRWEAYVFESEKGQIFFESIDEVPESLLDDSLKNIIENLPECVLLMDRSVFEKFERASRAVPGVELGFVHCESQVATS